MPLKKKDKIELGAKYKEVFNKASATFVAEYRGLTVADVTQLRKNLRKANAEFKVLKNRVAKKIVGDTDFGELSGALKGPVGVVYAFGDAAQAAKALVEFEKSNELFKINGGVMEKKFISAADLKVLSSLPSKEVLLSQLVGLLVAPHRQLLGVLNGVPRQLVTVISALKDKKA